MSWQVFYRSNISLLKKRAWKTPFHHAIRNDRFYGLHQYLIFSHQTSFALIFHSANPLNWSWSLTIAEKRRTIHDQNHVPDVRKVSLVRKDHCEPTIRNFGVSLKLCCWLDRLWSKRKDSNSRTVKINTKVRIIVKKKTQYLIYNIIFLYSHYLRKIVMRDYWFL